MQAWLKSGAAATLLAEPAWLVLQEPCQAMWGAAVRPLLAVRERGGWPDWTARPRGPDEAALPGVAAVAGVAEAARIQLQAVVQAGPIQLPVEAAEEVAEEEEEEVAEEEVGHPAEAVEGHPAEEVAPVCS